VTDTARNFIGIPVNGDITKGAGRVEQKPIEDLQPILQAVLNDPTVVEFGWRQYTPYFNDGEPCTFDVHGTWVRTTDDEDADADELEMWNHRSLGEIKGGEWAPDPDSPGRNKRVGAQYEGPDEDRYRRCKDLEAAVESGHFDHVLLDAFGDHAEITVRRDGIEVEFYDHD